MPDSGFLDNYWLQVMRGMLSSDLENRSNIRMGLFHYTHNGYAQLISQAYNFFRRNSDGRYSSRSLISLSSAFDAFTEANSMETLPILGVIGNDYAYDEETEIKRGGPLGMVALFPGGKVMLTVAQGVRRKKIGSVLCRMASTGFANTGDNLHFWVAPANAVGQHFLLANGYWPTALNSTGVIRYGSSVTDED